MWTLKEGKTAYENNDIPPELPAFASLLGTQPPKVQEAFQFLLATAMHEAGKFELLNLAGGFPAKHTLLVTAISRCQKTSQPKKSAIKLPTMELPKLTTSLFSQGQGAVWTTKHTKGHERREMLSWPSFLTRPTRLLSRWQEAGLKKDGRCSTIVTRVATKGFGDLHVVSHPGRVLQNSGCGVMMTHFGGRFQRSYLSARPSANLAALSLGILVSLSGICR